MASRTATTPSASPRSIAKSIYQAANNGITTASNRLSSQKSDIDRARSSNFNVTIDFGDSTEACGGFHDLRFPPAVYSWIESGGADPSTRSRGKVDGANTVENDLRFNLLMGTDDLNALEKESTESQEQAKWVRFDLFFGVVIAMNGLMFGVVTDHVDTETAPGRWPLVMESIFLVAFIVEFACRLHWSGQNICSFLKDPWAAFDCLVISISVVDNWILTPMGGKSGVGMMSVLRVFRLLRLIRLVRLLKLLKELWLLVSGLMNSLRILFWAVLMLIFTIYIFALFLLEFINNSDTFVGDPHVEQYWGGLLPTMLTLTQIATGDGWGDIVRYVSEGPADNPEQSMPELLFFFVIFLTISLLGILNLIVGVLLTSALEVTAKDDNYYKSIKKMKSHQSLQMLKQTLHTKCTEEYKQQVDVSHMHDLKRGKLPQEVVLEWMHVDSDLDRDRLKQLSKSLHFRPTEEHTVAELMCAARITEEDINMIYAEVKSIIGKQQSISVDDFIEACMWIKGQVHALDVLHIMAGLRSLHHRLHASEAAFSSTIQALLKQSQQLEPVLQKLLKLNGAELEAYLRSEGLVGDENAADQFTNHNVNVTDQEKAVRELEKKMLDEEKIWMRFDVFFGCFVFLNGVCVGIQADMRTPASSDEVKIHPLSSKADTLDMWWFIIENTFLAIFICELVLRAILFYQLKVEQDMRLVFKVFPIRAWDIDCRTGCSILRNCPEMFKDPVVCFDAFIVTTALVDLWILKFMASESDIFVITIIRLFRLLKLLRLVRLIHLLRELALLVRGMIVALPLLFWATLMLLGVIFMGAVFMVEVVGRNEAFQDGSTEASGLDGCSHAALLKYWHELPTAMITLLQTATFDHWGWHSYCVNHHMPGMLIFFILFITITGLGICNLIIGVMVQAAFRIVRSEDDLRQKKMHVDTKEALIEAKSRMFEREKKERREREREEEAKKADGQLRKQNRKPSTKRMSASISASTIFSESQRAEILREGGELHRGYAHAQEHEVDDAVLDESILTIRELQMLVDDPDLNHQLEKIGVRVDQVLMVFQKLDITGSGKVDVNEFIQGMLRLKQRVQGVDVAAAKSWMRRFLLEGIALEKESKRCLEWFGKVLNRTSVDDSNADEVEGGDSIMAQRTEQRQKLEEKNKLLRDQIALLETTNRERRKVIDKAMGISNGSDDHLEDTGEKSENDSGIPPPPNDQTWEDNEKNFIEFCKSENDSGTPPPNGVENGLTQKL